LALGLALIRTGDADQAMTLIEASPFDWTRLHPRWKAVYAAILGTAGQTGPARQAAHQIDLSALKSPERRLIKPWLQ